MNPYAAVVMPDTSDIEIRMVTTRDSQCKELLQRQQEEINLTNPTLAPFATDIPIFMLLVRNDTPIACGGLRPFTNEPQAAEIKRVYVAPEARGRSVGVADLLMKQLEAYAMQRRWRTVRLQTSRDMVVANRFYERHGYRLLEENYGEYVECLYTISYEKMLS